MFWRLGLTGDIIQLSFSSLYRRSSWFWFLTVISVIRFIVSLWKWKAHFQTEHQIALRNAGLISVPLSSGAPAGCCCFLHHLYWHGERAAPWPKSTVSHQNRKSTVLPDARCRQKTNQGRVYRHEAADWRWEQEIFGRSPILFCVWSHRSASV